MRTNLPVIASQNASALIASQLQDIAGKNENERNRLMASHAVEDISIRTQGESWSQPNDLLQVHVLNTDKRAKDAPLLRVRLLNKCHKGEVWYIDVADINPTEEVTAAH